MIIILPETGKRKWVTRTADGKLALSVNLGGVPARNADAFGYPFQLTHFSLPISGSLTPASLRLPDEIPSCRNSPDDLQKPFLPDIL